MNSRVKHMLSVFTAVFFICLAIASVPSKETMTVQKGQVPPDFKGYSGTLLIVTQTKNWTKYAKKHFKSNYKGKYLFIKQAELANYSNKEEYRYVIGRELNVTTEMGSGHSYVSSSNICVTDRQSAKVYCTGSSSNFGMLLKRYSAVLEEERLK